MEGAKEEGGRERERKDRKGEREERGRNIYL